MKQFRIILIALILVSVSPFLKAEEISFVIANENEVFMRQCNQFEESTNISNPQPFKSLLFKLTERKENVKLTAAILALALGPLGVHRLYLGTHPIVPVAYVLTLGGGLYILPFIDFVAIVFTKDITRYMDNKQFFMWVNKEEKGK